MKFFVQRLRSFLVEPFLWFIFNFSSREVREVYERLLSISLANDGELEGVAIWGFKRYPIRAAGTTMFITDEHTQEEYALNVGTDDRIIIQQRSNGGEWLEVWREGGFPLHAGFLSSIWAARGYQPPAPGAA